MTVPNSYGMPRDDEIRLAMGELTADQMRTAKAAIRWALTRKCSPGPSREVTPYMIEAARALRVNLQFGNHGISGPISPFEAKEIWQRMYDASLDATNRDGEK